MTLSSQQQGRLCPTILVLPASHPALSSQRHAGCGRSSTSSQRHTPRVTTCCCIMIQLTAASVNFLWQHLLISSHREGNGKGCKIYTGDRSSGGWPWFAICLCVLIRLIHFCVNLIFHDFNLIRFHRFLVAPLNPPCCHTCHIGYSSWFVLWKRLAGAGAVSGGRRLIWNW